MRPNTDAESTLPQGEPPADDVPAIVHAVDEEGKRPSSVAIAVSRAATKTSEDSASTTVGVVRA